MAQSKVPIIVHIEIKKNKKLSWTLTNIPGTVRGNLSVSTQLFLPENQWCRLFLSFMLIPLDDTAIIIIIVIIIVGVIAYFPSLKNNTFNDNPKEH